MFLCTAFNDLSRSGIFVASNLERESRKTSSSQNFSFEPINKHLHFTDTYVNAGCTKVSLPDPVRVARDASRARYRYPISQIPARLPLACMHCPRFRVPPWSRKCALIVDYVSRLFWPVMLVSHVLLPVVTSSSSSYSSRGHFVDRFTIDRWMDL